MKKFKKYTPHILLAALILFSCSGETESLKTIDTWLNRDVETLKAWHLMFIVGLTNLITNK